MESALELLGLTSVGGPDPTNAFEQADDVADSFFQGRPTELTNDERQELNSLRNEFQRLMTPQMETRPIGRLIPGNEFSVSTAGLSQGLNQLVRGMEAGRRKQALFGDFARRQELQSKIDANKTKIAEIEENAEKIRNGIIPAENLARLDPMADAENVAQSVEEQAQALREEIELYESQLESAQGVAGRTQAAEENYEQVQQNRAQKDKFTAGLGSDIYKTGVQRAENAAQRASLERREQIRQDAATERTRIQQREITQRTQAKFDNAASSAEYDATEFTPGQYQPDLIRQISHDVIGDIENEISALEDEMTSGGEYPLGMAMTDFPKMADQYRELHQSKQYVEMIQQAADSWKRKTFRGDRLPEWRPPSELEQEIYDNMLSSEVIHPEMVQAWLHYNEIDPAAPPEPLENPNKRQPGIYIFSRDQYDQ